jgi:drug/metabolite transporter (DMT)-like permease
VTSCLEPVFAILLTAVLLGEWVSPMQVVGMLIVLSATFLIQNPDAAHHEPAIAVDPIE